MTSIKTNPHSVVAFHYPCPDGFAAAVACFAGLTLPLNLPSTMTPMEKIQHANITFIPLMVYESEEIRTKQVTAQLTKDTTVYLVDFMGGISFVKALCAIATKVIVLDHHKTSLEDVEVLRTSLPNNLEVHFDMNRSGATMARDYFSLVEKGTNDGTFTYAFGTTATNTLLQFFELVEDHDLWRHKNPDSIPFAAAFAEALKELDINKNSNALPFVLSMNITSLVARGKEIDQETKRIINDEITRSFPIYIAESPTTPALSCLAVITLHSQLRSELGNSLAKVSQERGFAPVAIVSYEETASGRCTAYKVSFRSLGDFDTTPWARKWGGGGHRNASSAMVEKVDFETWKVKTIEK